jgi:hypothetical protein
MQESTSRHDLFDPGHADNFFEFAATPVFDPVATASFYRGNALWLAEFSRFIYRRGAGPDEVRRAREQILRERAPGWSETDFFQTPLARAALYTHDATGGACLVFRGTLELRDFFTDAHFIARSWQGPGKVHSGFKASLDSVWDRLAVRLRRVTGPIFFGGHSLGGALAALAAVRTSLDPALPRPAAIYTFGSPRVGDAAFRAAMDGVFHCRMVNDQDVVTTIPPAFSLPLFPVYQHCGHAHRLLADGSLASAAESTAASAAGQTLAALREFMAKTAQLVAQAFTSRGQIPKPLMDHAPVNYVARLERVREKDAG